MKYTTIHSLLSLFLATSTVALRPAAAHKTASPYMATSAGSLTPAGDDPSDSVLTIRKRVDEVNVLFIATDKHGKFVRDLNQATSDSR